MEHRGAGASIDYAVYTPEHPMSYYDMANSVLLLIDALNLTHPDVLGWSTGGDVALILAALHGDQVGKVVGYGAMAGSNNTGGVQWLVQGWGLGGGGC